MGHLSWSEIHPTGHASHTFDAPSTSHSTAHLTTGMPWGRSGTAVEQKVKGQWNCALKVPGILDNCLLSSQVAKSPEDWVYPEDQK